jgi:hypothetical protein
MISICGHSANAGAPAEDNFGDKLTTIGIVVSQIDETLPFVVDTATEMGFTIFDAGHERIYRPKNWRGR